MGCYGARGQFLWQLVCELAHPQLAHIFPEELAEPLQVVGTGGRGAVFPAADIEREGGPDAVGDLLLRPPLLLACCTQQAVGRGLGGFLDHLGAAPFASRVTKHGLRVLAHHPLAPL